MTQRKPIISARRTENLEALLQKLWALRPMYKGKQAFTITAGVAALIREVERTDLILGVSPSSAVTPAAEETVAQEQNAVIALEGQTEQNLDNDEVW